MKAKKQTRGRKSSFNRALVDAQSKLERAQVQLAKAELRVVELRQQIPHLQRIISALGGSPAPAREVGPQEVYRNIDRPVPEELKPFMRPTDLSGMASIPNPQPVQPNRGVVAPETEERVPTDDDPNAFLRG